MDALSTLAAAVAAEQTADASAATLIRGIAAQLSQHGNTVSDDKLLAFAAALNNSADALSAAVVAVPPLDTPASAAPTVVPGSDLFGSMVEGAPAA